MNEKYQKLETASAPQNRRVIGLPLAMEPEWSKRSQNSDHWKQLVVTGWATLSCDHEETAPFVTEATAALIVGSLWS